MSKKILIAIMALIFAFGLTACGGGGSDNGSGEEKAAAPDFGETYNSFADAIDLDYAKKVNEKIASFGDDETVGMRSAGSPAEMETIEYLEGILKEIGLKNVTVDETTLDCWTFKGANVTFTNKDGKEQKIDLGGYQTTLEADNEEVELVDVNRGTEDDYKDLDVNGKLVLLDVNQEEDWWINYPAYQAKVKGAKAVIAMREFVEEGEDRIGVQDICGPADAPALAISNKDATALRDAIKASGEKSIKVKLNADSKVTEDGTSHNLYGEIPGKTDETIFVFSHVDGYFHAAYDDAQGVGVSIGIAKALVDSGFTPDKTIRFCFHGAEEWGREGSEYDWSSGAYEEIMTNHPEWIKGAFAIVNNDGGYAVEGEKYKGTRSSVELKAFVEECLKEHNAASGYEWSYDDLSTYTEDFQWTRVGIPAIVAGSGEGTKYDDVGYHSSYDSFEAQPLDEKSYIDSIQAFGKVVIDLDARNVRPFKFTDRITAFEKSLAEGGAAELKDTVAAAKEAAGKLDTRLTEIENANAKEEAVKMNEHTQEVYLALQDSLLGLDFVNVDAIIRHDMYEDNIENFDAAIAALENGDIKTAYDEYLSSIDWSWYDMYFDEETCDYMKNQLFEKRDDTWGSDLIEFPHADTGDVVRSLKGKYDDADADVKAEIEQLKELKATQKEYLAKVYEAEKKGLEKATELMNKYANE